MYRALAESFINECIEMNDGPHGLRHENFDESGKYINTSKANAFASSSLLACSFNKRLAYNVGKALAKETSYFNVNILLAPGVNIKRNPLCGRNFEYFSEDPILAGKMAANYIRGIEDNNVGVSLKHFCCNNKEENRCTYNVNIDERTLREIYLKPFEICVKEAKPTTIMSSYNKVNGYYSGENYFIANDILRKEWGFNGVLLSDWGACFNRVLGIKAGQDLEMPYNHSKNESILLEAIKKGELLESELDICVKRILMLIKNLKEKENRNIFDFDDHKKLLYQEAIESIVLLKNDNILPLKKKDKILVIGKSAANHILGGGGSSEVNPLSNISFIEELKKDNYIFDYIEDYNTLTDFTSLKNYDDIIYFISNDLESECEGYDRKSMKIDQKQYDLISKIYEYNQNIIGVIVCGSPIELPCVSCFKGLFYLGFSGQMGAKAIKDIIYGKVNPSGKLAETWLIKYDDCPNAKSFLNEKDELYYEEAIYVGYRYYEKANIPVLFPFGYGLSYSKFKYDNLNTIINKQKISISFDILNISNISGKEIAEIYLRKPQENVPNPLKELKEFRKIKLKPNEKKKVKISIPLKEFMIFDLENKKYVLEEGIYQIMISSSSLDIRLEKSIYLKGVKLNKIDIDECYFDLKNKPSKDNYLSLLKYNR